MSHAAAPDGVLNTYGDLAELKRRLNVTGVASDSGLWMALHAASRAVDGFCNRIFYTQLATRTFDVADPDGFAVPDLVSVVSLREDANRDRLFETAWSADDYMLYPLNAEPESPSGRPYSRVTANPNGGRRHFTTGRSAVQVEGLWGYRSSVVGAAIRLNTDGNLAQDAETIAAVNGADAVAGRTLQIEAEQVYVRGVSGNNLTVLRGVNGTQAVAHVSPAAADLHVHPPEVVEAALMLAGDTWKRKDARYVDAGGAGEGYGQSRGLHRDVAALLSPLRRLPVGSAI